jgi:hypothetical protein
MNSSQRQKLKKSMSGTVRWQMVNGKWQMAEEGYRPFRSICH